MWEVPYRAATALQRFQSLASVSASSHAGVSAFRSSMNVLLQVFRGHPRCRLAPGGTHLIARLWDPVVLHAKDVASQSESSSCDDVVEFARATPSKHFFVGDMIVTSDL